MPAVMPAVTATASANSDSPETTVASDASSDGTHRSVGPSAIEETSQPSDSALAAATGAGYNDGSGNGVTHDSSAFGAEGSYPVGEEEEDDDDSGYAEYAEGGGGAGCDESACSIDFGDP